MQNASEFLKNHKRAFDINLKIYMQKAMKTLNNNQNTGQIASADEEIV